MGKNNYIRVATTLYKKVRKPLQSGDFIDVRIPWNYETLRQDESKDFISTIEKYDGFCCVPSHTNYKPVIGTFLNDYESINIEAQEGEFSKIKIFLRHIFGEQYELGLDYLQLLYTQPIERLPILLLVSKERNTGKTTFLNLLKSIFGANMTFNTNEDFRSQFNSDWATKLIVAVDEVLLDRREDSERIKNLSTARNYKAEAKGKDRNEVEFFAKFILCSNNESKPIYIESGEIRYWVRKVGTIKADNPNLLEEMRKEIPALLYYLLHRQLSTAKESRMWFKKSLIKTDALTKIITSNRGRAESEILHTLDEIMEVMKVDSIEFCVEDLSAILDAKGMQIDHHRIRHIIKNSWSLEAEKPRRYISYRIMIDGTIEQNKRLGRCYTLTRQKLNEFL